MRPRAFTLVEILVVIAVIAVLAAILFPVFARAKEAAKSSACLEQTRQTGQALALYLGDTDGLLPDRRDLKVSLGYRPWGGWPPSDPRSGWAMVVLEAYVKEPQVWSCPAGATAFRGEPRVEQTTPLGVAGYWMWRFDRTDEPVPLDNFWGKTEDQAVSDLRDAGNQQAGRPEGASDTELLVDVYFPKTVPTVPSHLKGRAAHTGGRNRLFLDLHAKFLRDSRLD